MLDGRHTNSRLRRDPVAPGERLPSRAWDNADDRMLAIVAAATIANVLLLAVLALVVL